MTIAVGIIAGLIALIFLFKPFFDDWAGFWECIVYSLTPDIISIFRGEWAEDWWAEMKLFVWLALGMASGFAAYTGFLKLFPGGE